MTSCTTTRNFFIFTGQSEEVTGIRGDTFNSLTSIANRYAAYTDNELMARQYARQITSIQGVSDFICCTTECITEAQVWNRYGLSLIHKLTPMSSEDHTVTIIVTERFIDHPMSGMMVTCDDYTDWFHRYVAGVFAEIVKASMLCLMVLDKFPSIRELLTDYQLKSIELLFEYAIMISHDGMYSKEVDYVKLIAYLWGWDRL